jgi:phosphatidylinositol alpha-1,6-mannosyltransferase
MSDGAMPSDLPRSASVPGDGSIRIDLAARAPFRPSRYLVITELFLPTKGGTAVWFDEVYRRLGGKEIHVVTADLPGAAEHDACHPNTIHRIIMRRYRWLRPESLAMYCNLLGASLAAAARNRFDVVHAGRVLPEGMVGWLVARLLRVPLVIYAHGEEITTWRTPSKLRAMTFTYRHADCVIANSDFTRQELLKLGVHSEYIVRISPGVDINRFRPGLPVADLHARVGKGPGKKLILSVGRLSRRKGFDQVVRVLPVLLAQGIDVLYAVIGIGEDQCFLKELARELGVADRVHLLGHVPMEDLPRWYNAANVFAMPNREIDGDNEGFGMVFLEAAACGKASIAGRDGGTGAAVVDGMTGIRVDGRSLDAIANALARVLGQRGLAEELGANGYARARAEFAWERVAEKTLAIDR